MWLVGTPQPKVGEITSSATITSSGEAIICLAFYMRSMNELYFCPPTYAKQSLRPLGSAKKLSFRFRKTVFYSSTS